MEIIDSHAHIYPEKIAEKASKAIGDFYDLKMAYAKGTTEELLVEGKNAGISRFLVHSVATTPHQVHSINMFILSELEAHPEFIGFMTLHQGLSDEEVFEEVKWAKAHGFKGIKLHPDFQKFAIDDKAVYKFYDAAVEYNMPILFHTGDKRYSYSNPIRLVNVANDYPDLKVIGAHFGGYSEWCNSDDYKYAKYDNVYFDTSSSLNFLSKEKAVELIHKFGADRFFFGTDFPMWDAKEELDRFLALGLTTEENEKILSGNLKKLLGI